MNLRERLEAITPLKETTREVINMIIAEGLPTGSRIFGVDNDNSDMDIIIEPNASLDFSEIVRYHNGIYLHAKSEEDMNYRMEGFQSLYVLYRGLICNLLFMETQEYYDSWKYATDKMKKLCENSEYKEKIRDKKMRVELFEEYKEEAL